MKFASPYDGKAKERSALVGIVCKDASLAVQSQKEEADINTIVRRFGVTGMLPQVAMPPTFGDFSGIFDFMSAQNMLVAADRSFKALPADVRKRFGNDPQEFVKFCSDDKNLDEMRKMGLAVPKVEPVVPAPMRVEVVNPVTPPA